MKSCFVLSAILLAASGAVSAQTEEVVYLYEEESFSALAIQSTIATGGNLGIGLTYYTDTTELGFTASGLTNTAEDDTKLFVPVIYGGLRVALGESTYFAYGLDLLGQFGHETGKTIAADYKIGPYISLEQELSSRLLLVGWIDPYSYEYKKEGDVSISTNRFFADGGIGLSYYF